MPKPSRDWNAATDRPLGNAFLANCRRGAGELTPEELEARLVQLVKQIQQAWPALIVDSRDWVQHLGRQLPSSGSISEWLSKVQAADLYLAYACAQGDTSAIDIFERKMLGPLARVIGEVDRSDAFVSEVQQQVRRKLLVGEKDAPGRIAEYAGFGPLSNWLKVVATRTALNLRRTQNREDRPRGDALLELPVQSHDLELEYLKNHYRKDFSEAFCQALAALSSQDRNLLRLHFVDGLTMSQVGAAYQADKSTVSRWIAKVRKALLEHTRRELGRRLNLAESELDSLMALVRSQLDLSISSVLRKPKPE